MQRMKGAMALAGALVVAGGAAIAMCGPQDDLSRLRGAIKIDGSSTVYPITEAVAEEFQQVAPNVRVTVGISGTGGGFKRFTVGETDISDASRPIKTSEYEQAKKGNIEFIEVPVAYDGVSIVVNPGNYWVDYLTVDELKMIFLEDKAVNTWNEVRAGWPDRPIKIYAPGTDSGTFDYFKEVVADKDRAIRGDMSVSEDDNVLVRGVSGDEAAIGFFGVAYYMENQDKLKIVPIINPKTGKSVKPTPQTIESGEYAPFSRPLFIYVNANSLRRPEVRAFVDFYLKNAAELADEVGYVRLPKEIYSVARRKVEQRETDSVFINEQGEQVSGSLRELYK